MKELSWPDLEEHIYKVWQTGDDVFALYNHQKPMSDDEISNTLLGIKQLHDIRCAALLDAFCKVFELDQYCTDPEKLAAREELFNIVKPKKKGSKK